MNPIGCLLYVALSISRAPSTVRGTLYFPKSPNNSKAYSGLSRYRHRPDRERSVKWQNLMFGSVLIKAWEKVLSKLRPISLQRGIICMTFLSCSSVWQKAKVRIQVDFLIRGWRISGLWPSRSFMNSTFSLKSWTLWSAFLAHTNILLVLFRLSAAANLDSFGAAVCTGWGSNWAADLTATCFDWASAPSGAFDSGSLSWFFGSNLAFSDAFGCGFSVTDFLLKSL